jgi:hypothetical protein
MTRSERFERKHGAAYRQAVAAARRATPGYQPGQLPPAPRCEMRDDGQVVRLMLDEHERQRQGAVDAVRDVHVVRGPDGRLVRGLMLPAVVAICHLDPAEERIRRMAARP